MRVQGQGNKAYPQSYPQIMWMGGWAIIGANKILWSVGFVHHHTSGWLADLAPFDLLNLGIGLGHRTFNDTAHTTGSP